MNSVLTWLMNWNVSEAIAHDDVRLVLRGDYNAYARLGLLVVLVGLVSLTVRSYRQESQAHRATKLLVTIRLAVIGMVFVLMLQPAIAMRFVTTHHRPIVLLVDDSESMSFTDDYSSPSQLPVRRQLAQSLGVDEDDISNMSRRELLGAMLQGETIHRLSADHPVIAMKYAPSDDSPGEGYVRPLGMINLVDKGLDDEQLSLRANELMRGILARLDSSGSASNQGLAIRGAIDLLDGESPPVIIHFGDGQDTTGIPGLANAVEYARHRGATVWSVLVGDPTPIPEVRVSALMSPREARRGSDIEFQAVLTHRNMHGSAARLTLLKRELGHDDWIECGEDLEITLDDDAEASGLRTVTLQTRLEELGEYEFLATVETLNAPTRPRLEPSVVDNDAIARVRVVDEKIRVLVISGYAGWEYQSLKRFLLSEGASLYSVSFWQQNADSAVRQAASTGMNLSRLPRTLEELLGREGDADMPGYNLVILHDPVHTAGGFDRHFVENLLEPFVRIHGRGLCYIAGNKNTRNVLGSGEFKSLGDLLPVVVSDNEAMGGLEVSRSRQASLPVVLTPYGIDHPVTRLVPPDDNQQMWQTMPHLFWAHPLARTKPGARVLAVARDASMTLADSDDPLCVIATQPYGAGNILYMGSNESWRWRAHSSGFFFRRFWDNAIIYLSAIRSSRVTLTTGQSTFAVGDAVTIEIEAFGRDYQPLKADSLTVDVVDIADSRPLDPVKLTPVEGVAGAYRSSGVRFTRRGTYRLTPRVEGSAQELEQWSRLVTIETPRAEHRRPEADEQAMRAVALPGDRYLTLDQSHRLVDIPPHRQKSPPHDELRNLYDTPLALLVIVALLSAEWIIRKKHNMA